MRLSEASSAVRIAVSGARGAGVPAAGRLGDVIVSTGDAPNSTAWQARSDLAQQPSLAIDLADAATYQILGTFSSPATRFTHAVVSGELRVTTVEDNTFAVGAGVPVSIVVGRSYVVRGRCISVGTGSFGAAGVYLCLSPSQPAPGAAVAQHNSAAVLLLARGDGAIAAFDYQGLLTDGDVTVTPGGAGQAFTDETVTLIYEPTDATSGRLKVYLDGVFSAYKDFSGLPANCWLVGGIRTAGAGSVHAISAVEVHGTSLDVTKRIYLDASAAGGGDGSETAPFTTSEEVNQAVALDVKRKALKIILRAGTYTPIIVDPTRYEEIDVIAAKGEQVTIDCAELLAPGGWAQIGSSAVWHRPSRFLDNSADFSGLVDVTSGVTQAFGRTGSLTLPHYLYDHLAANVAYNDASFTAGRYSVHTSGTYAGEHLVRCVADANPNTKSWKRSLWTNGLSCISEEDGTNACRVTVTGIDVAYAFGNGFNFGRCNPRVKNCTASYSMSASGFEFNYCDFEIEDSTTSVTYADGFHSGGDGTAPDRVASGKITNCDADAPSAYGDVGSDGFSPHPLHRWTLIGCRARACGKDGLSTAEGVKAYGFEALDCIGAGISIAPVAGSGHDVNDAVIEGGLLSGNTFGVILNAGASNGISATVEVRNVHFEANATNSIRVFGTGTGLDLVAKARGCMTSGAAPSGGHKSATGGTISVLGAALT